MKGTTANYIRSLPYWIRYHLRSVECSNNRRGQPIGISLDRAHSAKIMNRKGDVWISSERGMLGELRPWAATSTFLLFIVPSGTIGLRQTEWYRHIAGGMVTTIHAIRSIGRRKSSVTDSKSFVEIKAIDQFCRSWQSIRIHIRSVY